MNCKSILKRLARNEPISYVIISIVVVLAASFVVSNQQAYAVNSVSQVIKVNGSLVGGVEDEDFLLPTAVTDQNKTIIFMSVRHNGDGQAKQIYRSWDFVNNTAIRFHGSNDVPGDNLAMDFVAYLVEFTASSTMIKQNGTLIVDGADVDQEFVARLSPTVNQTNSFQLFDGLTMDHSDLSWGSEEFGIMRVINNTDWGYEPFDAPNTGPTEVRFSVVDWNDSGFVFQNGTGTLVAGVTTDTITPVPAIDRRHTMVLMTTQIEDELDATADEHGATISLNVVNDIVIERDDAVCPSTNCEVNYRWELTTFPTTFANVTHGEIDSTIESSGDVAQSTIDIFSPAVTNFDRSIAIGTTQTPFGLGNGRDSSGGAGSWDRLAYTLELLNNTAVNGTTNDGQETPNIPYQVIEFLVSPALSVTLPSATNNVNVTDTFSLTTTKVIDSAINNVNVTDTVSLTTTKVIDSAINNVNVTDTVSTSLAASQTLDSATNNVNVTDTVSVSLGISQTLDSATNNVNVTDTVSTAVGFGLGIGSATNNVNVTDTVSVILGASQTLDSATNNANVTDTVVITAGFNEIIGSGSNNVNVTDTVSTILGASQTFDSANNNVNVTDTVSTAVGFGLGIGSASNNVNITDTVDLSAAFKQIINDIILVNDTFVNVTNPALVVVPTVPVIPPGGGGPATTSPPGGGGGGGVPSPISPSTLSGSLTGLQISEPEHTLSTEIIVNPFIIGGSEQGSIEINWDQLEPIKVTKIEIPPQFQTFVDFKQEQAFEFKGEPANNRENFATGLIQYEVKIPALALGISPETNNLGDNVRFFDYFMLVLFNEYTIPVEITAIHNGKEFLLSTEITVTHLKEVRWIIIALTIAGGAWLVVWGKRVFTNPPIRTGSFKKGLDKARRATIEKKKSGSFRKELERQRQADRNNIRKIKRKQGKR